MCISDRCMLGFWVGSRGCNLDWCTSTHVTKQNKTSYYNAGNSICISPDSYAARRALRHMQILFVQSINELAALITPAGEQLLISRLYVWGELATL